jgi:hypothetical protein
MRKILLTFGAGRTGWQKASRRLLDEGISSGLFDSQVRLDRNWLYSNYPEIVKVVELLHSQKKFRGFGYWVWKPAVLHWGQEQFPNDQIVYIDAGSHIRSEEKFRKSFGDSLQRAEKHGSLAWNLPHHNERQWTKLEAINLLKSPQSHLDSNQIQSGFISLMPSKSRVDFIRDYREISLLRNGFYFTDDLELHQRQEFIEHRHDQSILSLLWKKHDLYSEIDQTTPLISNTFGLIASRNNTSLPYGSSVKKLQSRRYIDVCIDKILKRK